MNDRTGRAESIVSWEYDEVTDISEDSQSQANPQSYHLQYKVADTKTLLSNRSVESEVTSLSGSLKDFSLKESEPPSSKMDPAEIAAMNENDFESELEEKGGEATQSASHDGQLDPPSTSDGGGTSGGGGEQESQENGEEGQVEDLEENDTDYLPGPSHAPPPPHLAPTSPHHQGHPMFQIGDETDEDGNADPPAISETGGPGPGQPLPLARMANSPGRDDDDDEEDDEDDDDDVHAPAPEGAYDPADFEHLNVSPEIEDLFSYITRYTPQAIELEHRLRPYIPDYIPAVGDIDAFIKIPPPDGKPTLVGLEVLDEPSARQSDATVLDLQLRALAKHTTAKSVTVKTVENAEKNTKVIEKWVRDISELHRAKPPPTVHYSKRMPDIDSLMQEWPGEVEDLLKEINLPTAALDLDLPSYVDIICATMDIPVYKSRIQSLHVLFTLYSVFKNSAHFRQLAEENYIENDDSEADRLIIQ
ncbi:intraflagellar transport protein 46 homolog isoform X1 [Penaeus indicus]|uniref:intraflagellar transport protein 46 homolog isoform X1 n=2 Tax=Penaeus indicus TaxID=29960 RepID=UPI00300D0B53